MFALHLQQGGCPNNPDDAIRVKVGKKAMVVTGYPALLTSSNPSLKHIATVKNLVVDLLLHHPALLTSSHPTLQHTVTVQHLLPLTRCVVELVTKRYLYTLICLHHYLQNF